MGRERVVLIQKFFDKFQSPLLSQKHKTFGRLYELLIAKNKMVLHQLKNIVIQLPPIFIKIMQYGTDIMKFVNGLWLNFRIFLDNY